MTRQEDKLNSEDILNSHLDMIDNEIKAMFKDRDFPKTLYDMMQYHLGWLNEDLKEVETYRGKRFRPTLLLLTYNSLSGVYDKALPAAAAIELIHNFSLIHDDIEDQDEERRHRPTVWKLWGVPQAINVGDGMHVMANLAALRLRERNVTETKIVDVLNILNNTVMKLCEGQFLDMSFERSSEITVEKYIDMVTRKTAALIEAAAQIGALIATEDKKLIEHFRRFGRKIGVAFQIRDDIIGIWEKAESTGKPKASDIRNKKKTLPILYAFAKSSSSDRKFLEDVQRKSKLEERDVEKVLNILEKVKAYDYSQEMAKRYEDEALRELSETNIHNEAMEKLKTLSTFLVRRTY